MALVPSPHPAFIDYKIWQVKANDLVHLYQIGRHLEIPDLSITHVQMIAVAHMLMHVKPGMCKKR